MQEGVDPSDPQGHKDDAGLTATAIRKKSAKVGARVNSYIVVLASLVAPLRSH
jgi:hypothetical protein